MRQVGRYEVVRELGRGGMGVVLEVRDPEHPERALALKLVQGAADAETLARFAREAQALARVRHPGVVAVHAFDRTARGEPYLLTDLVPGRDLTAHVAATGRPAPEVAAALVRDLADALVAVHAAGVVHRDLKPANVLIRPDGSPVIIDFGLARATEGSRLTATGTVLGTVAFMPPEQADGAGVDARADVYGLGATLYWLLTGQAPFGGPPLQALHALLHKEPPWPRELDPAVPRGLDALVRRAMAKAPGDRFPDAAALRDALTRWLVEEDVAPPRRGRGVLVAGALLAAAAVGGLAAMFVRTPGSEPTRAPAADVPSREVATGRPRVTEAPPREVERERWPGDAWAESPSGRPVRVAFLDDARLFAASVEDGVVRAHAFAPGTHARTTSDGQRVDRAVALVPERPGRALFSSASHLYRSDGETVEVLCALEDDPGDWTVDLAYDPASARAYVARRYAGVVVLDLAGSPARRLETIPCRDGAERNAIAVQDGRLVELYRTPEPRGWLAVSPGEPLALPFAGTCLAVDPATSLAAVGLRSGLCVVLCDVSGSTPLELAAPQPSLEEVARVPDGHVHAVALARGRLWVAAGETLWSWGLEPARLVASRGREGLDPEPRKDALPPGAASPLSLAVSPDRAWLALGGKAGGVFVRGVGAP